MTQTYDPLGRLLTQSQPFGSVSYQYDAAGRMNRLTWADGLFVTYDYNTVGSVTVIRENGATSGGGVLATYSYNSLGRRTAIARGNGTSTAYVFDPVSRLTSLSQDLTGTSADQTIGSMTYSPAGQIISQSKSNDAFAWSGHYNVARNYTVNGLNQQTTAGATTLGFDPRGNLTTSGTTAFTYNKLNQLTGTSGVALTYDPAGQLSQITGSSGTTRFTYAGNQIALETDGSGVIVRRYVPGPRIDEPVVWYEGFGTASRRWLHSDERGSVIAVSDGSGAMLAINRYDEYGIPQSGNLGRFQYTGQTWMPDLGMYNYKARMYSPTLGRFMQTDPIGYGDGLNWYNYVGSDPVNATDPSGLGATDVNTCSRVGSSSCSGSYFSTPSRGLRGSTSTYGDGDGRNLAALTGGGIAHYLTIKTCWESRCSTLYFPTGFTPDNPNVRQQIPDPPSWLPGGPYEPKPDVPGNRPGSFQGPKQPSGPRPQAQWVPPSPQNGNRGYWKVQEPGGEWIRFDKNGVVMSPEQAHPGSGTGSGITPWQAWRLGPWIGAIVCALACNIKPAY